MRLEMKAKFPEMKYIVSVLNRMVLQGNVVKVGIEATAKETYLCICLQRCRKYSFVHVVRTLESIDSETKTEISQIPDDSILLFDTDDDGTYVDITVYKTFRELPLFHLVGIPDVAIPELDRSDVSNLALNCQFVLRKGFYELGDLVKIFNSMLSKGFYACMKLRESKHLEISFFHNTNATRSILNIGFGLWIPYKNSKEFIQWDPNTYEQEILEYHRVMLTERTPVVGKFYYVPSGPSLEFRAIARKAE